MLNKIIHVKLNGGQKQLEGQLQLPDDSNAGLCLFVHGSGSSRFSPRNRLVADHLYSNGIGFLLLDLLTPDEEREDNETRELRFDIPLLAKRVVAVIDALQEHSSTRDRPIALFGASTGAAAAIMAAYERPDPVECIISRGGRPDLVPASILSGTQLPSLFIVGGNDASVLKANELALNMLGAREKRLEIVPHATHLFIESGALEQVAVLASNWCLQYLRPPLFQ